MADTNPDINSLSFVSFVANSDAAYKETIKFYNALGFQTIKEFDPRLIQLNNNSDHCLSSTNETWLLTDCEKFSSTSIQNITEKVSSGSPAGKVFTENASVDHFSPLVIKLRLTTDAILNSKFDAHKKNIYDPDTEIDWRGVKNATIFKISNLKSIQNVLSKLNSPVQSHPNNDNPIEIYTIDPLSNLIGFTVRKVPLSTAKISFEVQASTVLPSEEKKNIKNINNNNDNNNNLSKKIGIMTSGGDSPGMAAAVRSVVRSAIHRGCQPFAIYEGYKGLVNGGNYIKQMDWFDVRGWLAEGGTPIGTARCAEFREKPGRLKSAKNLILNGIDALIVCGGDGSLTGADLFRQEWPSLLKELVDTGELTKEQVNGHEHLNIAGLVGSIDNDMAETDTTIGAYSSLARICEMVDYIDTTAQSHSRAFIVEVMGRHCGWLALMSGVSTNADFIFIPERPVSSKTWKNDMCDIIKKHRTKGKRKTLVIVAEGAIDDDLQPITSEAVKNVLVDQLQLDTRITTLGHVQRGGPPVAYDRLLATLQGYDAVDAILAATPDTPSPVIGVVGNKITRIPLMESVKLTKSVATCIANKEFDKAMSLRDTSFSEYYEHFCAISDTDSSKKKLPENERLKIAIIHIGAPAGGMNAATRAAAAYCFSRGHKPYAIYNGFTGLTRHDSVHELNWLSMEEWGTEGGSEIGTNRTTPDVDMGMVAWYFQKYQFNGLIIIGGFEAFISLYQLSEARTSYPALRIPMVLVPATISNNVPGSEYSLGSDTCLNVLTSYCDVIKQSASSTRRRVFVVEVQGGHSGYIATVAGLVCGAVAVFTPEEGITLKSLLQNIDHLRESFAVDQGVSRAGKLIIRNEKSSDAFTTEILANIIRSEANGRFEARSAIPGHVQQGGAPSPIDRIRAIGFAISSIKFLEQNQLPPNEILKNPDTAAVIGIRGAKTVFTSVKHLYDFDTEHEFRRSYYRHWHPIKGISDMLSGRPNDL